jgi:environmental stress-induced protein Ves
MRILRHSDHRRMPWKNGLGVTEEVIAFPPDSDLASFGWRVSIAHVGADGPFSVFVGIDRTIALLDGAGLLLDLPDERTVELAVRSDPFAFSGDLRIASRNKAGATIDLNVMTRRGRFRHDMQRLEDSRRLEHDGDALATLFLFNTPASLSIDGTVVELERFDVLLCESIKDVAEIAGGGDSDILRIRIFPAE